VRARSATATRRSDDGVAHLLLVWRCWSFLLERAAWRARAVGVSSTRADDDILLLLRVVFSAFLSLRLFQN